MSIIKELEQKVKKIVATSGYDLDSVILEPSSRPDLGDYQLNDAMKLSKIYYKSPISIANKIAEELKKDTSFTNINIAGPGFINISLSDEFLINTVNLINNDIRTNIDKENHKKIIIDYGGANVAKSLHVGHLRSANIGEALKRLAKLLGQDILGDAHLGDYGRPLGLVVLEIKKRYPDLKFFDENFTGNLDEVELPITNSDLEKIYPYASSKAKEDEAYLEEARDVTSKIQNHERGYYDVWKKVVEISKADIKEIYKELNVEFELWEGESDGAEYIPELLEIFKQKNLIKESEGALIVDVKEADDNAPMPPLLLLKSNNTASYQTTDLATILERRKKFNPDEIWYCVDLRQKLHFDQVFRAARKAELVDAKVKLEYMGFGTVNGPDGKPFKTRDGGVMSLKNLLELVKEETRKRINYDIVKPDKVEETINIIASATLKYADFLPFRATDYIFNLEKFSDIEGKTAPYLLYSTIRMRSLLNKGKEANAKTYYKIKNETDRDIVLTLLRLPKVLTKSYEIKSLNEIAEYLYTLTSKYNKFYADNKVLLEEDSQLRESWLILTKTVYSVNTLLLDTLGLSIPEKM